MLTFLFSNIKKLLVSRWHPRYLDDALDLTWWPDLTFCYLFGYVIVFFSTWCGAWRCMVVELSPMIISFFLSLLPDKMHDCSFFYYFSISILILLISYFVHILFIEVFYFKKYSFNYNFLKIFCFQFHPLIKVIVVLFFFNLTLIYFFFFC
jgi:hypothetical protein